MPEDTLITDYFHPVLLLTAPQAQMTGSRIERIMTNYWNRNVQSTSKRNQSKHRYWLYKASPGVVFHR